MFVGHTYYFIIDDIGYSIKLVCESTLLLNVYIKSFFRRHVETDMTRHFPYQRWQRFFLFCPYFLRPKNLHEIMYYSNKQLLYQLQI